MAPVMLQYLKKGFLMAKAYWQLMAQAVLICFQGMLKMLFLPTVNLLILKNSTINHGIIFTRILKIFPEPLLYFYGI